MPTFAQVKRHVLLAVGGYPSLAAGQTNAERLAEVVNQAGQYLFQRPWRFRERTSAFISLVASQDYVALPADVEEIISLINRENIGFNIELVTPDHLQNLREIGIDSGGHSVTYACLSRTANAAGAALNAVRLELFPTPTAAATDAIAVRYRAGWTDIASGAADSYEIPIPKYIDTLFIQYCLAFGMAYEDEGLSQRLMEIDAGPILAGAMTKDGILQRDIGRLRPSYEIGYSMSILPRFTQNPS
jgi:hypothetical protein